MRIGFIYLSFILFTAFSPVINAAKFYRHVPFTIAIEAQDSLVINYDFSEKKGIQCASDSSQFWVEFAYKGREKTARLPVILESAHIPTNEQEELADLSGQFTLFLKQAHQNKQYKVSCDYA